MGLTLNEVDGTRGPRGHLKQVMYDITPDATYPAGGESLTPEDIRARTIYSATFSPKNGATATAVYDYANEKLELFEAATALTETFAIGDFTDNANTTGYVDFTDDVPAGAVITGWKAVVATGFTGDTTAVIQVGVAGDLDRFSADTAQSVLAAGTVGSAALAADTADGLSAAVSPRITVTGGADFGSIAAGSMTVSVFYSVPAGATEVGVGRDLSASVWRAEFVYR